MVFLRGPHGIWVQNDDSAEIELYRVLPFVCDDGRLCCRITPLRSRRDLTM